MKQETQGAGQTDAAPLGEMPQVDGAGVPGATASPVQGVMVPRRYRKTALIEAHQWFKNGDHPADYANPVQGLEGGEMREFSPEHQRSLDWSGQVVGRYRHPDVPGTRECSHCRHTMHDHGWIDTLEGGHIVCPGDWIATGVKGEHWPIKPDVFAATYEPAEAAPEAPQRKPLTDEQVAHCVKVASLGLPFIGLLEPGGAPSRFSRALARAIERAHGIAEA